MTVHDGVSRVEELGISERNELAAIAAAWRARALRPEAWFAFIHGEVLARKA